MLNNQQLQIVTKTIQEIERQTHQFKTEMEKFPAEMQDSEQFAPVYHAVSMHNQTMYEITRLLERPDIVHRAVWDHCFDALVQAHSNVIETLNNVATGTKTKSPFEKLLEQKIVDHADDPKAMAEFKAGYTSAQEKFPDVKSPDIETIKEEHKAEPVQAAETVKEEHKAEPIDMNKPCKTTQESTDGKCETLAEAAKLAQESGMKVVHSHKDTTPEPTTPEPTTTQKE